MDHALHDHASTSAEGFIPHGHCYLWKPGLVWLHVVSDALIGFAYVFIAVVLYLLVRRIRIPFSPTIGAFGLFIFACGLTHWMEIWTLWKASYWVSGYVKATTALASVATALYLIPIRPKVAETVAAAALSQARQVALEAKTSELELANAQVRQFAREEVRVREERFRSLVFATAQIVFVRNAEGHVVEDSPTWLAFTGQSAEEHRGVGWLDAIHPEDRERVWTRYSEALRQPTAFSNEYRLRKASGEHAFVAARIVPLLGPAGDAREWVGAIRDVSDQKRALKKEMELKEIAEQAVRARDEFLTVAAHELRTPLTAMKLQLELLERAAASCEVSVTSNLDRVRKQVDRLVALNEAVLDVGQLASGRFRLRPAMTSVDLLVREVVGRFGPEGERRGCVISVSAESFQANVDPVRIDQVVSNLMSNALKFGAQAPIDVSVRRIGSSFETSVTDHGPGIPDDVQQKLFQKFHRGVSHAHYGGLGLGLYVSHAIAEQMGGKLTVVSRPGSTCVTFVVPFREG